MHEGQQVFVTFSAGVTLFRIGEAIEGAVALLGVAALKLGQQGRASLDAASPATQRLQYLRDLRNASICYAG